MMKTYLPLVSLAALLGGCSPQEGRVDVREWPVFQLDFEAPLPALSDSLRLSLTAGRAHSGRTALRIDSVRKSSGEYRVQLGKLFRTRPLKLRFSAWAWVEQHKDDARVIVAVTRPDDSTQFLLQQTLYVADSGPYGEWQQASMYIDVPGDIDHRSQLVVYARHGAATAPVYLDDWELTEIR